MDNPFTNLDFKRWYNMLIVSSFIVFVTCLGGVIGIYTPNDMEFLKTILIASIGFFFIGMGESSTRFMINDYEIGEYHQINPLTGESWGHIPNVKIPKGKKEIRKIKLSSIAFYLLGITFLALALV
ncbi:hypothetical protein CRV02_01040 [Arcobacter sp. CECT 8989]|uniref:hypothetical protein n=1 Tax=Arcobacter sp. CECT 8989 TaxID=2044509 RepID=UPI00100B9CEE|nr:hypothetical protein [Arcobacter sp. CECT 8989]RXK03811.1 hypothetical protein CRV02_01040 [Arcobacter sp. CECT 8989]